MVDWRLEILGLESVLETEESVNTHERRCIITRAWTLISGVRSSFIIVGTGDFSSSFRPFPSIYFLEKIDEREGKKAKRTHQARDKVRIATPTATSAPRRVAMTAFPRCTLGL